MFLAAGGRSTGPIARESLRLSRDEREPLELAVARGCVDVFCLGETVAVPLFKVLREGCEVPVARRMLDRVLRDEVRHRDFGWTLLAHLLDLPAAPAIREMLHKELPRMLARLKRGYAPAGATEAAMSPEDRAWGLMPAKRYGEILARTVVRDYVPRFRLVGLDATEAWAEASKLAP